MSPKITLTPERKAQLKKDVLDSIGSVVPVKSEPVKKDAFKVKKTPQIVISPKVTSAAAVVTKQLPRKQIVKSPIASKNSASKIVSKAQKSKAILPKKVAKKKKADILEPIKNSGIKSKKPSLGIKSKNSLYISSTPKQMISDDFSQKEEAKTRVNPLIAKIRQANAIRKQERSVDDFFAKSTEKKAKKGFGFYLIRLVIFLILLAILAICVDIYGIYRLGWRDRVSYQVTRILPLPAATVNGKSIRLSDYLDDVGVLQTALANQREGLSDQVISPDNKESVIDRLVLITIIDEQLNKYGKTVSEQDLDNNLDSIVQQFNGKTEAEQNVKKLYGINLNQFKTKVLKPLLSKNLLQSLIVQDDNLDINKNAKAKAQLVLELALKPGANFAELAKQYTEDEAGINTGGDLGFISKGEATPEIEQILFSLPANTVYDKIITNSVGYHIIMVENKLNDPQTGKESVKAKQIFVKVDVDKYLKDLMVSSKIVKYVK